MRYPATSPTMYKENGLDSLSSACDGRHISHAQNLKLLLKIFRREARSESGKLSKDKHLPSSQVQENFR